MSRFKHQATFKDDGYKRVLCLNCWHFLMENNFEQKYTRRIDCNECKNVVYIAPPRKEEKDGKSGVFWGPKGDSCWTAVDE